MRTIDVGTDDGTMPVHLHLPIPHATRGDGGALPGLILFMDAPGIRPALHEIAARLAGAGHAVALPDLFYRAGPYPPVDPRQVFTNPVLRAAHRERFVAPLGPVRAMADLRSLLAAMASWPEVAQGPIGAVGYCMGGRLALIAAGTYPDAFAVAASFHAGGLADDTPSSPHLLADRMGARVYVAGAIEDANFPDAMKARLVEALVAAQVQHEVTTYPARHGWVPRDTVAHDQAEAEHHWRALLPLLDSALRRSSL